MSQPPTVPGAREPTLSIEQVLERIRFDPVTKHGSVYDVISLVTGCGPTNIQKTYQRILLNNPEFNPKVRTFRFAGKSQRLTPTLPIHGLVEIVWLCPGRNAREFRVTGANTLCRALGGDLTLVEEIRARHADVAGTEHQAALLEGTGVTVAEANGAALVPVGQPRGSEDAGLALVERKAKLTRLEQENMRGAIEIAHLEQRLKQENINGAIGIFKDLSALAGTVVEGRQRIFLSDMASNILRMSMPGVELDLRTDGTSQRGDPISISAVLLGMGRGRPSPADLVKIGREAARLFREARNGENPPKHDQFVGGASHPVNSYFECDRGIIEEAVRNILGGTSSTAQ
jgi:hypothetical protein